MKIRRGRRKAAAFVALTALVLSALVPMTAIADESDEVADDEEQALEDDGPLNEEVTDEGEPEHEDGAVDGDGSVDPSDNGESGVDGAPAEEADDDHAAEVQELSGSNGPPTSGISVGDGIRSTPTSTTEHVRPFLSTDFADGGQGGNASCTGIGDFTEVAPGKRDWDKGESVWKPETADWPTGLTVTVHDDRFVSFSTTVFDIDAVIVKGGPASNVYFYDPAVGSDTGLAAPGGADLSNLTFCGRETTSSSTPTTSTTVTVDKSWIDTNADEADQDVTDDLPGGTEAEFSLFLLDAASETIDTATITLPTTNGDWDDDVTFAGLEVGEEYTVGWQESSVTYDDPSDRCTLSSSPQQGERSFVAGMPVTLDVTNELHCVDPAATPTTVTVVKEWRDWNEQAVSPTTATAEFRISLLDDGVEVASETVTTTGHLGEAVATFDVEVGKTYSVDWEEIDADLPDGCVVPPDFFWPSGASPADDTVVGGDTFEIGPVTNFVDCRMSEITVNKFWEDADGNTVTPTEGTARFDLTLQDQQSIALAEAQSPVRATASVETAAPTWTASTMLTAEDIDPRSSWTIQDVQETLSSSIDIPNCVIEDIDEDIVTEWDVEYPSSEKAFLDVQEVPGLFREHPIGDGGFSLGQDVTVNVTNIVTCGTTPTGNGGGITTPVTPDPDPDPEFFVAFEKIWDLPDDFEDFGNEEDLSVTFAFDGETLAEGQQLEVELDTTYAIGDETVTGLDEEFCTVVASDLPDTFATPAEAEDGEVFTITVTNTVECEADVLAEVEEQPEQPERPELPEVIEETPAVEVLGVTVEQDDEEMPKTGASALFLTVLGLLGIGVGGGLLGRSRRTES